MLWNCSCVSRTHTCYLSIFLDNATKYLPTIRSVTEPIKLTSIRTGQPY